MLKKLRPLLTVVANHFFIAMLGLILLCFFVGGAITKYNNSALLGLLQIVSAIGMSSAAVLLYRKTVLQPKKMKRKTEIVLVSSLFAFYAVLSFLIVYYFAVSLRGWDPGELLQLARSVSQGEGLPQEGWLYSYFSAYPFQVFSGYFNGIYLWFMHHICGLGDLTLIVLLNTAYVNGAILFSYLSIRKKIGAKSACFFLCAFPFLLPMLLYIPIAYTDTSSMFYLAGAIFFSICLLDKKNSRYKTIIYGLLFAIFATLAICFKVTSAIFLIALGIYLFLLQKKPDYKKSCLIFAMLLLVLIPTRLAVNSFTSKRVREDWKYPTVHWLYMGTYGEGGFSYHVGNTAQDAVANGDDVSAIEMRELKNTVSELGVPGLAKLYSGKIARTWLDGSYFVFAKLRRDPLKPDSAINHAILYDYNQPISYALDVFRISRILLIASWAVSTRKKTGFSVVLKISIIGVFIFFLFWETRSRYTLNYLPVASMLWIYSLSYITSRLSEQKKAH